MSEPDPAPRTPAPAPVPSSEERARLAREALVGRSIAGRYVLRSLLGHGGMGAVYEAEHLGIGKKVAIKFVDPDYITDEQVLTRFAREARAMSAIESAHIVTIFDAGTEDGRPYLVMELLRGEDLGQRLRRTTRVPLAESLHIIAMVLKGLTKAHAAGIVHRDLKPDNVFLVKNDDGAVHAKIVDFGVSKIERPRNRTSPLALTGRGTILGTPFYMSPEQAQAVADLDGRADLFSVGAILFECLAGRPPFPGETYEQVILAICMRDAPDLRTIVPETPANVAAFVAKALARERAERFASADEMLAALHELSPDERRLVPREPLNQTLVVGTPNVKAPSVRPFQGNATQIAGSGATGAATPVNVPAPAVAAVTKVSGPEAPPVVPPRRSPSAIVATAVVALLLGLAATMGVVSALGEKEPPPAPTPSAPVPAATRAPVLVPVPVVSLPSETPAPTVSAPPAPPPPPKARPAAPAPPPPPAPKASGKALDIARDLP